MGLSVIEVTAYSVRGEIAHSVPFLHGPDGGPEFYSWLAPGDPGPARSTRLLNPSVVPGQRLYVGPWGTCLVLFPGGDKCWSVGERTLGVIEDYSDDPRMPRVVVIAYRPDIAYLLRTMSNGTTQRVPVVRGAGMVFAAFKAAPHLAIIRWGAYDAAGHRLYGGLGSPDSAQCPPPDFCFNEVR